MSPQEAFQVDQSRSFGNNSFDHEVLFNDLNIVENITKAKLSDEQRAMLKAKQQRQMGINKIESQTSDEVFKAVNDFHERQTKFVLPLQEYYLLNRKNKAINISEDFQRMKQIEQQLRPLIQNDIFSYQN